MTKPIDTGLRGIVMRRFALMCGAMLLACGVAFAAGTQGHRPTIDLFAPPPSGVAVFTISGVPVTNVPDNARVVELDRTARLDLRLSRGVPNNKQAAIKMVKKRARRLKDEYGAAYTGLLRAWRLGVEKVPAVVVDGQYVVYGQADVAQALARIRNARKQEATP